MTDKFNLAIKQNELYTNDSKLVGELLHEMATRKIVRVGKCCINLIDWLEHLTKIKS